MEKDSFVSFELGDQHVLTPLVLYILKYYNMVFWDLMWCSLGAKKLPTNLHCTAETTYQTTLSCSTYLADQMVSQPRRPKSTTHYPENLKYYTFIQICTVAWTGTNLAVCAKVEQKTHFSFLSTIVTELKVKSTARHTWILQQFSCHHC
jgi:hypothetical protein